MAQQDFVRLLRDARYDRATLARYSRRDLAQLVFHAKNDGYDFTPDEVADVVGRLEANVIVNKDQDAFDGGSRLWRQMWGRYHFEYLVECCVSRHTDEELAALAAGEPT
ncbi:hypothetical protein ODJ79_38050 [Actinoplanes sp. KI2]|uniref:hypothetical protein n=1 Tax=Actinoplanes sp. KI2 TaxID=2983315 RepID=UPI0021D592FB|nr:hypothetical protein [Actinoplanes sp. KI2]MCU7729554.1 hypothetical protein [Actinoplanes sp. KI2]